MPLLLASDDCTIREWRRDDKPSLLHHANNHAVWRNLTHLFPHPYTEADAERWFDFLERQDELTHWAIEVDDQAVGGIGMIRGEGIYHRSAEIGYWLGEDWWGRGIATAAVGALVPELLRRYALIRLEANVFAWNTASMRVLEKCGFVREAVLRSAAVKDGRITDLHVYAFIATLPASSPVK
jgi:RimJ/RimL family protein N-acetyltransferase